MSSRDHQRREVERQVKTMLGRSAAFRALPSAEQQRITHDTSAVVDTMAQNGIAQRRSPERDPYAVPFETGVPTAPGLPPPPTLPGMQPPPSSGSTPTFTGGAQPGAKTFGPQQQGDFGTAIATGTSQAGELLRQVNFPAFVAELVQGVFQAVVDASIQQMRAYGELVQSVAMSLNDFRDANVSENQGRDHLVSKFPNLMQINVTDGGPRVGLRPGADEDELGEAGVSLGLGQDQSVDADNLDELLVPIARNDLARSRQSLLATVLLMGINRIVVTDGKINAKLKFDFAARDTYQQHAQQYDYDNFGVTKLKQSVYDRGVDTGENYSEQRGYLSGSQSGTSSRWTRGTDQYSETPAIYLSKLTDTVTGGELEATAKLAGEVSLNFKTESVDLTQLATSGEIFSLERVRSAGRAAPGAPVNGATAPPGGAAPDAAAPPAGNAAANA
jgi:hypothetical protein